MIYGIEGFRVSLTKPGVDKRVPISIILSIIEKTENHTGAPFFGNFYITFMPTI